MKMEASSTAKGCHSPSCRLIINLLFSKPPLKGLGVCLVE
uniref:Uncharacterized protein n=1 Tax=Anguilla anguilla TaxID=7936 RepID=A0A0E9PZD6_ANGAN